MEQNKIKVCDDCGIKNAEVLFIRVFEKHLCKKCADKLKKQFKFLM